VSSQEGAQHCTELTPNDSAIPILSDAPQVQQHAEENSEQNDARTRPNGAFFQTPANGTRNEVNQPRTVEKNHRHRDPHRTSPQRHLTPRPGIRPPLGPGATLANTVRPPGAHSSTGRCVHLLANQRMPCRAGPRAV
jgi:hypothetical protein